MSSKSGYINLDALEQLKNILNIFDVRIFSTILADLISWCFTDAGDSHTCINCDSSVIRPYHSDDYGVICF